MSQDPVKIVFICILFVFIVFVICRYVFKKNKNRREIKNYINFITLNFRTFAFLPNFSFDSSELNKFNILLGINNIYSNMIIEGTTDRKIKFKLGKILITQDSGSLIFVKVLSALSGQGANVARIPGSKSLLKGWMIVSDLQESKDRISLICTKNLFNKYKFDTAALKNCVVEDNFFNNSFYIYNGKNFRLNINDHLLSSLKYMNTVFSNGFFIYLNNNKLYVICPNEDLINIKCNSNSEDPEWKNSFNNIKAILYLLDEWVDSLNL